MITLRIRAPSGTFTIKLETPTASLASLREQIFNVSGISAYKQELRVGFPPKLIDLSAINSTSIADLGIKNGEMVTVAESISPASSSPRASPRSIPATPPPPPSPKPQPILAPSTASSSATREATENYVEVDGSYLVLRVVPDDNSCLFTAVGLILESGRNDAVNYLRNLVASTISSDSDTWSDAVLGRSRDSYISTITSKNAWGGAIELAIFAKHYKHEICSVDVKTGRIDTFGQGEGFDTRILLVYSGIHYDALTQSYTKPSSSATSTFPTPNLEFDTKIFTTESDEMVAAALKLVAKLRASHSFTDTAGFTLKCEQCNTNLVGEKEAQAHATATGHTRFGEYQ